MFNLEEFQQNQTLYPIVEKLNRLLEKEKLAKIPKIIEELEELLEIEEYSVSVTYILSVLAEIDITLISPTILDKIIDFINSTNPKLKSNSLILLGFPMLKNQEKIEEYLNLFIKNINDRDLDIRENVHFFLKEVYNLKPDLFCSYKDQLIEAIQMEHIFLSKTKKKYSTQNMISIFTYLIGCNEFSFEQLFDLRSEVIDIMVDLFDSSEMESNELFSIIKKLIIKLYPSFNDEEIWKNGLENLIELLKDHILMKRYDFTEISKKSGINLKDFIESKKQNDTKYDKLYFYIKSNEKDPILFFELEKSKLINNFEQDNKISKKQLLKNFSIILKDEIELRRFIDTLIKLKHIRGYYSKLGYYYPYQFIWSQMSENIQNKGMINLKNYDYLPPDLINKIIQDIAISIKQELLISKTNSAYFSLKRIQQQVNTEAAKNVTIDLKAYRERLSEKDFIKLIKKLPKDYLTSYHKGTQFLTNLGLLRIQKEIDNSKLVGYYSIPKLSEKLNINKLLLVQILEQYVDKRSGVFDKSKETFYYSKFLNQKIDIINSISDPEQKEIEINKLTRELNVERSHILSKIDENLKLIGEEIKQKDQISIVEYTEKTGMEYNNFIEFIEDLELKYFKKGDLLIFSEKKIDEAKSEIKSMLVAKSRSESYISLGDLDVTSSIVEGLLIELKKDAKVKGIFYNHEGELIFYTEKGLENLMLENQMMFSFEDFFYGKELNDEETELLINILNHLMQKRILRGTFDEENNTFFSTDVIFAQNYNGVYLEFEKMINHYLEIFNTEFQKLKKILTKRTETIFPQEIKVIQDTIDTINERYIHWRSGIEAFVKNANTTLLKKQGYTMKRYKAIKNSAERNIEIKLFEEDPEVVDLIQNFNKWVKLINNIEIKYGNIIFYQKRLIQNPQNEEIQSKFNDLLEQLNLT